MAKKRSKSSNSDADNTASQRLLAKNTDNSTAPKPAKPRPPKIISAELISVPPAADNASSPTAPAQLDSAIAPSPVEVIPPELVSSELPKPSLLRRKTAQALRGAGRGLETAAQTLESGPPSWLAQRWSQILQPLRRMLPQRLKAVSDGAIAYTLISLVLVITAVSIQVLMPPQLETTTKSPSAPSSSAPSSSAPGATTTAATAETATENADQKASPDASEHQTAAETAERSNPEQASAEQAETEPSRIIPDKTTQPQRPTPNLRTAEQSPAAPIKPEPINPKPVKPEPPETSQLVSQLPLEVDELTPAQQLQIDLETQLLATDLPSGLLLAVQPGYRSSDLTLRLSRGWYSLSPTQQDQTTAQLLARAHSLDFIHLQLWDSQGQLLARDAATHEGYVMIHRQKLERSPRRIQTVENM